MATSGLLVTMNTGGNWMPQNVVDSHRDAARRWGYAYHQIEEATDDLFGLKQRWLSQCTGTGRVLWVDGDLIIRYDCPDPCADCEQSLVGVSAIQPWEGDKDPSEKAASSTVWWLQEVGRRFGFCWFEEFGRHLVDSTINGGMIGIIPDVHRDMCRWIARHITFYKRKMDYMDEQALIPIGAHLFRHDTAILPWEFNRVGPMAWKPGPMRYYVQHLANCGMEQDKREALAAIDWTQKAARPGAFCGVSELQEVA